MSSSPPDFLPAVLDREIASFDADAFGHRDFARALCSLIKSEKLIPPYSIGLLGSWGSGKSSVKAMCIKLIEDQIERKEKIKIVTFNAWRFGGENIKRALLREVYLALEGRIDDYNSKIFCTIEETKKEARNIKTILFDIWERTGWPLIVTSILCFVFLLMLLPFYALLRYFGITAENAILPITVSTPALLYLYYRVFKWTLVSLGPVPRYSETKQTHEPRSSAEEFEEMLKDQLEKYACSYKKCERIIVFVDDLDRLSASEMVEGLDAIRSFLDLQHSKSPGIVFVISCDEQRIAEALAERNLKRLATDEIPGAIHDKSSARRYLDRIFQFRLEIPVPPKLDLSGYARDTLKKHFTEIVRELEEKNVFDDVLSTLIPVSVHNPRNVLQLVNTYCHSWTLAKERERQGAGTQRLGGLSEGAVTNHPISLAAVTALRVNFPDFFNDLLTDPGFITKFSARFIHKNSDALTEDDELRTLAKYRSSEEESQDDVKPMYYSLRQYVSSIQGIQFPVSLQPLLLLAQDPISRKYQDGANKLYDAFVSGDHIGLLRLIGRENDDSSIASEDIQLLRRFSEDVLNEPKMRRDNAAACLANISKRLPQNSAHLLLVPVARQLAESLDLRSRLGIDSIFTLLEFVKQDDRLGVVSALMDDLLDHSKNILLRKQNQQNFSSDEAGHVMFKSCEYFLDIRQNDGLWKKDDERFLSWLLHRSFKAAEQNWVLPDKWFVEQFETHESHLLESLRERYSGYIIGLFSDDTKLDANIAGKAIQQCKNIFSFLFNEGEESRAILWPQLCDMAKVRNKEAAEMAWGFANANLNTIQPDDHFSSCVDACIERLKQALSGDQTWKGIDVQHGWQFLGNAVKERYEDISDDTERNLVELIVLASAQEKVDQILSIASILLKNQSTRISDMVTPWAEKVAATSIDISYAQWIASNFALLPQELQTFFINQCNLLTSSNGNTNEKSRYYCNIGLCLAETGLGDTNVNNHFNTLCTRLQSIQVSIWNQQTEMAKNYYTVVAKVLEKGTAKIWQNISVLGQMLTHTFTSDRPVTVQGIAHSCLNGKWPTTSELTNYDPQSIFSNSLNLLSSISDGGLVISVMNSLYGMIRDETVPVERESELLTKIMPLWAKYPDEVLGILKEFKKTTPKYDVLAKEAKTNVSPEHLENLLNVVVSRYEKDQKKSFVDQVLSMPSEDYAGIKDGILTLAVDATDEDKSDILSSLLAETNRNAEQRCRIWQQIINRLSTFNRDLILSILKNTLISSPPSELISYIFDDTRRNLITSVFQQAGEGDKLGTTELEIMVESQSQEVRNQTAQWMLDADLAKDSLKRIKDYTEKLTPEKIQFFKDKFPTHTAIKNLKIEIK